MAGGLKGSQAEFVFSKDFEIKFGRSNFLITNFKIPSVSRNNIETSYQNFNGYLPGTNLNFEPLNVNIIVKDDLVEFKSLRKWIESGEAFDFSSLIYNNMGEHIATIIFQSCLLNSISELNFDLLEEDPSTLTTDITIDYDKWYFI